YHYLGDHDQPRHAALVQHRVRRGWEVRDTMKRILLASAIAAAAGGCFKTNIHLSAGPGVPSASVNDAFHLSLIGIFELSSPVDLKAACGGSDAAGINEQVSVVGGIVNIILGTFFPILSTMNPTVMCGGGGAPAPAAAPPAG